MNYVNHGHYFKGPGPVSALRTWRQPGKQEPLFQVLLPREKSRCFFLEAGGRAEDEDSYPYKMWERKTRRKTQGLFLGAK